jgi:hypothetical protein
MMARRFTFTIHLLSILVAKGWQQKPTTSKSLYNYFKNSCWSVSKDINYIRGGPSGTFAGDARFTAAAQLSPAALSGNTPQMLMYDEKGTVTLQNTNSFTATYRLVYLFNNNEGQHPSSCKVYFDENHGDAQRLIESIMRNTRFFHDLWFNAAGEPEFSEHPCGPDVYRGRLVLHTPDRFELDWQVSGPRNEGRIISTYRRKASV